MGRPRALAPWRASGARLIPRLGRDARIWTGAIALLRSTLGRREHEEPIADLPRLPETDPRDAALRGMLWSVPLAVLTILAVYALSQDSRFEAVFKTLGKFCGVLLVPLLAHATQLVTNVQFWELSERWDELAGWQRGVFGLAIVLLAGGVILSLAFSVGMMQGTVPP